MIAKAFEVMKAFFYLDSHILVVNFKEIYCKFYQPCTVVHTISEKAMGKITSLAISIFDLKMIVKSSAPGQASPVSLAEFLASTSEGARRI